MNTARPIEPAAPDVGAWLSRDEVVALDGDGAYALRATRCWRCSQAVFPPSDVCPFCLAEPCVTEPLHGKATLYSHTALHNGPKRWSIPYAIGYADFANGLRLLAKMAAPAGPDGPWQIDQPVRLRVHREPAVGEAPERFRYFFESGNP